MCFILGFITSSWHKWLVCRIVINQSINKNDSQSNNPRGPRVTPLQAQKHVVLARHQGSAEPICSWHLIPTSSLLVVWCGVVWYAEGVVTKWQWQGWSCTRENASWEGCVSKCVLCVVCCAPGTAGQVPGSGQPARGTPYRCVCWCGWGPHCLGAVGSGTPSVHCRGIVVWCVVVWCVVPCGVVVWCGVVCCSGVVWCGVVWCAEGAVTKWQKAGMSTQGQR